MNEDHEEGELPDPHQEWDDYLIPTQCSPSPVHNDSPPEDIVRFHNLLKRAAKWFDFPMPTFQEPFWKSVQAILIVNYIWAEELKVMKTPVMVTLGPSRSETKYKAQEDAPAGLVCHPKPGSVITQAAQRKSKNPSSPITGERKQTP